MIVVCSSCATRLQLDDTKVPARPFTVRCPKCNNIINGQPPAASSSDHSALSVGESPATAGSRFVQPTPAPAFKPDPSPAVTEATAPKANPSSTDANELVQMLAALLQQRGVSAAEKKSGAYRLAWERRRALVCVTPAHREAVAQVLSDKDYRAYVASSTTQALDRMREDKMDVVVLEPDFDPVEQGAVFITREVSILRPVERRQLFFVQLSATARTLDAHAAFVNNVNLIVNSSDIENLPQALERAMRDFNDLYSDFNHSLNVATM